MYSEKFFKNSIKLLKSPFPVMLQTSLTRRALRRKLERHLGTQTLKALGHSGARRAFGHSGTQDTQALAQPAHVLRRPL